MTHDIASMLEAARTLRDGTKMSDERLTEVFDLVRDPDHWKNPIDRRVAKHEASAEEITLAVTWFAGGTPFVQDAGADWHVTGAGYFEWMDS